MGRAIALAAATIIGTAAIAQGADAAAATGTPPMIDTNSTVNYVMLGLAVVQVIIVIALSSLLGTMMGSSGWMRKLTERRGAAVLIPALMLLSLPASAQAYQAPKAAMTNQELFYFLLVVNIMLFIIILVQVNLIRGTMTAITGVFEEEKAKAAAKVKAPSLMQRMMGMLTRRPSREVEERDLLLHHEYDGIRELDNVLPPWWLWLFYGTIAWGVIYLINAHVTRTMPNQHDEYVAEMEQAKSDIAAYMAKSAGAVDENNVTITDDATALAGAKATFVQYCAACHGPDAAGAETSVGPNLTDAYWLHGGGVKNVFRTIKYGVPEKGMISWKSQFKPQEIQALASYILSLQGTGPSTQKPPQGDLWKDEAAPAADSTAVPVDTASVKVASL